MAAVQFYGTGRRKTSTAREFAVWYQLTGGVQGPVLFTSFERHLPLARLLMPDIPWE